MKPLTLALALVAFAPADTARGDGGGTVAEVVRFRLVDAVTPAEFIAATEAMQPALSRAHGFVSRRLSRGEDGMWTDYVVWTDLASALSAASEVFKAPAARRFADAIDGASIDMRHEPIVFAME